MRPLVDALERRLLLSGSLPYFAQASTDANYTLDDSSGSMVMDLNSGSLVVNADLSTGYGWTNPIVRLHNGAQIYFNAPQTLNDLELHDSSNASVALANASTPGYELPYGNFLQLDSLSVDSAATLDLGNNSMILYYASSQEAADKSSIYNWLAHGYNGGLWTGPGINSSAAAADSSHVTALGFGDNQDLGKTSFDGVTLSDQNQIFVRYTINGDANLDGVISSGVDGSLFSKGLNRQGSGWDFGDFNYDGSTTNPADLNLFQPNGTSITSSQYATGLQVQALPFTAYGFAAWSGDVATFFDVAHSGSGDPSDYIATVDWNNGTQPIDAQITQVPGYSGWRVNIDSVIPSDATAFTIRVAYAGADAGDGAAASATAIVTIDQLPASAIASPDAVYTVSPGKLNVTAGTIAFDANLADVGNAWQNPTVNASGSAHLIFNSPQTLYTLNLSNDATVTVSQGSGGTTGNVLQLTSLSMSSTATLDLGDNSMIVSANAATIQSLIASGYNSGAWNGPGIDSSTAANDATGLTSLGWIDNSVGWLDSNNNLQHYSSFAGISLSGIYEILVRYTLAGDANLDGVVDGTDANQASAGQSGQGTGWLYGDFNYDGTAGGSDDFGLLAQTSGQSIGDAQYAPAFDLKPLPLQLNWNTPFDGDIATFTDAVNANLSASDYTADVYWGDGSLSVADVTSTDTPGSFRINAISPIFTTANPIMLVTLQYAPGSGYQSEAALASQPLEVLQLPPGVNSSADAVYSIGGGPGNVQLNLTAGSLSFDTNASQDSNYFQNLSFTVSGSAHAYFNSPENFDALTLQDNAIVNLSRGSGGMHGNLLDVQSLSIDPNATLDLADNALIDWCALTPDASASAAAEAQMSAWLKSGYNGGAWNGPGIDSSVAADDTNHLTGLGWMDNGFDYAAVGGGTNPVYSSFDGVNFPTLNQLLVQFTYYGDANLDGTVDDTDLDLLGVGLHGYGTGWIYGDFNYDGITDRTSDLGTWDANYSLSTTAPNFARAFQPTGIVINPVEGVPFSGDLATFTDLLNPSNTDPSIYQAMVNWGDDTPVSAQVTATHTPGSFRINAVSPALTDPNAVITVTIQYADMNDPSPTYQGRPAAVAKPITMTPAVANLTASPASTSEIDLTWTLNAQNASAIELDRSTDGVTWQVVTTSLSGTATTYADTTGLSEATDYYYRVSAIQPAGPTDTWTMANAPSGLSSSVVSGGGGVTLSWTNNSPGAIGFIINRSDDGGATYQPVDVVDGSTTTYTDTTPPDGTSVVYQITAMDGGGGESLPLTSGPIQTPLAAPTDLSASAVSDTEIDLAWDNGSDGANGYIVERSQDGGDPTPIGTTSGTTFQDTGLNPDTRYTYQIRSSFGSLSPSDPSAAQSATTDPAQIQLSLGGDSTVGRGKDYTLSLGYTFPPGTPETDWPTSVVVDWGDGNVDPPLDGMYQSADHTYDTRGVYTINVTATSACGTTSATSKVIVGINPISMGFNIDLSSSEFEVGGTVEFTASLSGDALNLLQVSKWIVDWDDGSGPQSVTPSSSDPTDQTFSHSYANGGTTFDVAITAVTDQGLVVGDEHVGVQAPDDPSHPTDPPGTITPPNNGGDGGNGSGDSGTYAGGTFRITWCGYYPLIPLGIDWGDSSSSSSGDSNPSHPYSNPGQYYVTITDSSGTIVGGNWVNVTPNFKPTLSTVPDRIVSTGDAVDVSSTANEVYGNEIYEGYVDWGDGTGLHHTGFTDSGSSATLKAHLDAAGDPGQHSGSLMLCSSNEPYDHTGVANSTGFNVDVAGAPLLIDANNDDGLDVPTLDNTPESEQQTFEDTTLPGKLISVNTGDKDGDGIPDYADGYNFFTDQTDSANPPTSDQGAGFVPVTVQIPSWVDPANVQLSFAYSASNPNDVTRTGSGTDDDPYVYAPADGSLRLWTKDEDTQRNPASIGDGGDWIKPDETFPASDLNGTTTIYVEAVRPSTDLADDAITLTFSGSHLPANPSGTVHLTAFGMQYDQVNSDGTISPATQPQVSQPSPIIDLADYQLENVHFSSDFTQIIADIHLAGTVTDAASDLIPGADGTIHTIDVTLNGGNTSLAMIDLEVTKSDGSNSLLHPYAYSGSFDQTLTGVVVNAGWNLIHLSAANFYGYSGYAEASMAVDVTPDNSDITLSQDPYTADANAQITITFTRDGQVTTDTLKRDSDQPDLWINIADSITLDTSRAGGGNETLHLTDTTRKIDDDIVFSQDTSGVMHGTFVPDPETQDDYRNMTVAAGAVTDVTASTGGILSPIALEVVGPTQLENLFHQISANDLDFKIVSYQDKNFLQPWESNLTVPGLDLAMLDTSPSTDPVLASLNNPPRQDGLANFAKGFGTGVMDAGVSLRDGVTSIGKLLWATSTPRIIYHLYTGQTTQQVRQGMQTLKVAAGAAEVLYQAVKQQSQQVMTDLILGNNSVINALGEQYTKAFEVEAELLQQIGNWFENLDDYTFGKILGRITGEALVLVLTEGAGQIAELSKAALLQKLLPRLLKVDELAPKAAELTQFVGETVERVTTTKMCFVAGTLVQTDQGSKAIETIKAGDLVLSRDEGTGQQAFKPVLQTLVTHPTRLYHVSFRTQVGKEETLACTGEHPFYVATVGKFIPAKQLRPNDVLALAERSSAQILSVITEESLGQSFTTYNLEVDDFHTYFAGQAAVWVHNSGGGLCEQMFTLYQYIIKKYSLQDQPWEAFKILMQKTQGMSARIDEALPNTVNEVMTQVYKKAIGADGKVDITKIPTVKEMRDVMAGRGTTALIDVHHTAVQTWAKKLIPGITQQQLDAMPGLLLKQADHRIGQGAGSFHTILYDLMPYGSTSDPHVIVRNLQKAYSQFGRPDVWLAVREWLIKMGVNVP